jgi:hypothetical protein
MVASRIAVWTNRVLTNPTYSLAVAGGRDPHEFLAEAEGRICSDAAPIPCPGALAWAAKAALEASENKTAHDYAVRSLQSADSAAAYYEKHGRKAPRSYANVPMADFYGNFVLGRLAILNGDVRSAEGYLLASGKTLGDPSLSSGPNMSLALELLKHGDAQSRQVVLQYFDEVKAFWATSQGLLDRWSARVAAGETFLFGVDEGIDVLFK